MAVCGGTQHGPKEADLGQPGKQEFCGMLDRLLVLSRVALIEYTTFSAQLRGVEALALRRCFKDLALGAVGGIVRLTETIGVALGESPPFKCEDISPLKSSVSQAVVQRMLDREKELIAHYGRVLEKLEKCKGAAWLERCYALTRKRLCKNACRHEKAYAQLSVVTGAGP